MQLLYVVSPLSSAFSLLRLLPPLLAFAEDLTEAAVRLTPSDGSTTPSDEDMVQYISEQEKAADDKAKASKSGVDSISFEVREQRK